MYNMKHLAMPVRCIPRTEHRKKQRESRYDTRLYNWGKKGGKYPDARNVVKIE
jgi:hypothetical protein